MFIPFLPILPSLPLQGEGCSQELIHPDAELAVGGELGPLISGWHLSSGHPLLPPGDGQTQGPFMFPLPPP